jgi:tetratricopeptide (TPR) repeat protein/transcriptional regulator with XRE-family HTH domain
VAEQASPYFGGLLRQLRADARMTQEELAEAARLGSRTISDLERGINRTARPATARLLADALHLTGPARAQFEDAARGLMPGGAGAGEAEVAKRTLRRDIASFTGRQQELRELADAAAGAGGVVSIHAIGGMAGIGKTAFAVRAAHQLAPRFPAGQIFLSLHGHTPGRQPEDPEDALASLLLTEGVAAAQIPQGLEARAALWRDRLAGRQLLLVLDDAASSEQVRPLLPGSGGSLVLLTSRSHLSALEDARTISLDTLPPGEAARLLVRLADRPGLGPADPGVGEITRLCGCLPLAIGIVARWLHHHPTWSLTRRAAELAEARDRLELLVTENLSVAAAFNLSYANLPGDQQRLFRRLGLHPDADVDGYAAAALDGTGLAAARRGLEALYHQYLLDELAPGRFRMHNLIREHARALAERLDPDGDRDRATARLLDYYQDAGAQAEALLALQARAAPIAAAGPTPATVPAFADREQALAWARVERASLLACLDHVTRTGQHGRIIALTADLAGLLRHDGPWAEAITRHHTALRSAQHLGDRPGQAGALNNLGIVRERTGDYPGAARDLEEALGICRDLSDRRGQAGALTFLGIVRRVTGDYPGAARDLEEALDICGDIGYRGGEVEALNEAGALHRVGGDLRRAGSCHQQALDLAGQIGSSWDEAHALAGLGRCALATGHTAEAEDRLRHALEIFQRIGAAEAADVSAELECLTDARPTAQGS